MKKLKTGDVVEGTHGKMRLVDDFLPARMYDPPHPGEVIREFYLKPLALTITEAAQRLGVHRNTFSRLINGQSGISSQMALRLSKAFGRSPESWVEMQHIYNLAQVKK